MHASHSGLCRFVFVNATFFKLLTRKHHLKCADFDIVFKEIQLALHLPVFLFSFYLLTTQSIWHLFHLHFWSSVLNIEVKSIQWRQQDLMRNRSCAEAAFRVCGFALLEFSRMESDHWVCSVNVKLHIKKPFWNCLLSLILSSLMLLFHLIPVWLG